LIRRIVATLSPVGLGDEAHRLDPLNSARIVSPKIDCAAPLTPNEPLRTSGSQVANSFWPAAVLFMAAMIIQALSNTATDVSWLITLCEKTLDGQTPYVDFIESNPPAAIFIYMPGVVAGRLIGVRPEFMVGLIGLFAVA
jgi:hypothetical protein